MKKLFLCTVLMLSLTGMFINQQKVKASTLGNESSQNSIEPLNVLTEKGFGMTWEPENDYKANYDTLSQTISYQNVINLINPGGNLYSYNHIVGHRVDGTTRVLNSAAHVRYNMFGEVFLYKYQLNGNEKSEFTYFTVEVSYRDTLWNEKREATALFTL